MLRRVGAAAWLAVFMILGAAHDTGSVAVARNPECRLGTGVVAMKRTIWCVANHLGDVQPGVAVRIARRESGLQASAVNRSSGTCGIYQHQPHLWPERRRDNFVEGRWGSAPTGCLSGRANIIVSLTMVHRGGWGPWS